jgi:hypothetical protein
MIAEAHGLTGIDQCVDGLWVKVASAEHVMACRLRKEALPQRFPANLDRAAGLVLGHASLIRSTHATIVLTSSHAAMICHQIMKGTTTMRRSTFR